MGGLSLPGCGEGSACAEVTRSAWGRVPWVDWPVSFLGLAYFIAALVGWCLCAGAGGISTGFRWIVRIAALASLAFLIVMIVKGAVCQYCLITHLGNFAFWATMEFLARRSRRDNEVPALALIVVFFVVTLILFIVNSSIQARVDTQEASDLAQSTQEIIDGSARQNTSATSTDDPGFIGRFPSGLDESPIRIVVFSDYQCLDCKVIESQLITLLGERNDMLVSTKHFPFGKDCNPNLSTDIHEHACRAAAYAEAIGMIGGNKAFWRAHFWLFDHYGSVRDEELFAFLDELGIDRLEFQKTLANPEISRRIRADIEEGRNLGLHFTPMVFINGVQLRGYRAPNALINAVNQLAETNPPARHSREDTPHTANKKLIEDWRTNARRGMFYTPGRVTIDVIGDYTHPFCARANQEVLDLIGDNEDVIYRFHPFPFDQACNDFVKNTAQPLGCDAAKLVEVARFYGGDQGAEDVAQMILSGTHDDPNFYNATTINQAADILGADVYDLQAIMSSPDIQVALDGYLKKLEPIIFRGIPTVYVNGKNVPRWRADDHPVLSIIYDLATQEAAKSSR